MDNNKNDEMARVSFYHECFDQIDSKLIKSLDDLSLYF